MKQAALLGTLLLLSACHAKGSEHAAGLPSLPPGGGIKDGLLHAAIKARLAGSDIDSAGRISVIVRDGAVTLRGVVRDAATKTSEAKIVAAMRGVKSVNDELRVGAVGPSVLDTVRNAALVAAVAGALTAQTGVNVTGVTIRADARSGTVRLGGHAATSAIASTLVAAARKTPGVRNVVSRIAVK